MNAGIKPPIKLKSEFKSKKMSPSLNGLRVPRVRVKSQVVKGMRKAVAVKVWMRRTLPTVDLSNFQANLGFWANSCVTRCTSISSESLVTLEAMDSPCNNRVQRPLLVTPRTTCVAFTLRAKFKMLSGISSAEISWNEPPREITNRSILVSALTSLTSMPSFLRM